MHIHHSDSVIIWVMHSYAKTLYCTEAEQQREKKSSIYSCKSPLLGLHVRHQSIHSRKILHSQPTWKQRNKHAQYTYQRFQTVPNRELPSSLSLSFSSLVLSFPLCLSPHVWYVKVLFPCPGATYTQGKHRAVRVDDCQQWPFIICQASVLWGGKYTHWIMVVLVCRRNPTWQPAEGHDKIIYEEIVYHSHGKHCPSHMRRAMDPWLWQ